MLDDLVTGDVFALSLVFARIGAAVMLLPGFGENFVSPRIRLMIALTTTVVVTPIVSASLPPQPPGVLAGFVLIAGEVVIGVFLGGMARMLVSALHIAGVIIGFQTSLANATFFDPGNSEQGAIFAAFLNIIGVFLIFVTDLHHLMLMAVADSYTLFRPGAALPFGNFSEVIVRLIADSFVIGMQLSAPFIALAIVFYAGLGLLGRLMPQIQFFFIAVPLQIILAFGVMAMTLSAGMFWFLSYFQDTLTRFTGQG
ncbi:MAG: flagellar biosynthetic protein FliR [Rhodospirillaceae bacterium]